MLFPIPVTVKYLEKNLDTTKPQHSQHILPVPWPFFILKFHCTKQMKHRSKYYINKPSRNASSW